MPLLTLGQGSTAYDLQAADKFINDYLNERFAQQTSARIMERTPVHSDWREYTLEVTFQEDSILVDKGRFDLFTNELAVEIDGEKRYLPMKYVKSFWVTGDDGTRRLFVNPTFYGFKNQVGENVLEVLADGPIKLLREHTYTVNETEERYDPVTGGAGSETVIRDKEVYYLATDILFEPITSRREFWKQLTRMSGDSMDIKAYAKENRLKLNRPSDWPELVLAASASNN